MNDISDWLDDYLAGSGEPIPARPKPAFVNAAKPAPAAKRTKKAKKPKNAQPWFSKFPAKDLVTAMRLQFFNNGENPGSGRNQYTLKLRAYLGVKQIDQHKPDWERTIGLLPPKAVVAWAVDEHVQGRLTDEQLALYTTVADEITAWADQDGAELALMGHISSPPGNHYFHNQFVAVRLTTSDEMSATLYVDGEVIDETEFYTNTRSRKANAPKFHGLYDPFGKINPKVEGE
ncbi:hypothetical protein [Microvirga roseola]|uniref:hypothetical protein n=1 Tax=Microvirga roseola TaxID=2883126 RepID=UPI001E49F5F5|nr:hypothetical protein [Microvirga roseola]